MFRSAKTGILIAVLCATPISSHAQAISPDQTILEDLPPRPKGPLDTGKGPATLAPLNTMSTALVGGPGGAFGPVMPWPIIAIHVALLPDGRVLNFGTDENGSQGAQLVYDIWDPVSGGHTLLPNTTGTDIFCAGQSLLPTGESLIVGGDQTINGVRNYSNDQTQIFSPSTNTLRTVEHMLYPRWYPTAVPLGTSGSVLVLGGREDKNPTVATTTPELYTPGTGWRTLTGAASDAAFGTTGVNWYYPRAWLMGNGQVYILGYDGNGFTLNRTGAGTITPVTSGAITGSKTFPSVMFAPGKILSLRILRRNIIVNLNTSPPTITRTADRDGLRYWASALTLPDGNVLVTGGSELENQLTGVDYAATIWHPATGTWSAGAVSAKARLYHSTSLLLPDATVLIAGGGADGPVTNLNAELYYPPYLFDAAGNLAPRPVLLSASPSVSVANGHFTASVGSSDSIGSIALMRTGAMTHSFDTSQRFIKPTFTQSGTTIAVTLLSTNRNIIVPGYYMLFAFNKSGVPSTAQMIQVTQ